MYLIGFLLGLHVAIPAYITSSFLSQFAPEKWIGVLYAIASLVTIIAFSFLPALLRRYGNYSVSLVLLWVEFLATLTLTLAGAPGAVIAAFIASFVVIALLSLNMDIFLEHFSRDSSTGRIRGTYLVFINSAWVLSQLIVSFVITDSHYWQVFALATFLLIPVIFLVQNTFKRFNNPPYTHTPFFKTLGLAWLHKNIWNIYVVNFLLQFFYAWMVIYTPIYLHNHIGFSWAQISIMFSIMLLPFVATERPLGKIADRWLGEKELLVAGFAIMMMTTAIMAFMLSTNIVLWILVLFASRVGASMVEVMSETYFFKQTTDKDASLLGLFRTTRPWAYVIAPLIATLILPFVGIQYLFLVLAVFMIYGIRRSLVIHDTK